MRRRTLLAAALAAASPAAALAQTAAAAAPAATAARRFDPQPIEAQNALERVFLAAFADAAMRPAFRRQLLESQVALVLTSEAPSSPPFEIPLRGDARAALIFTSAERLDSVLGSGTPRALLTGRAALTRLRGKYVALNFRLAPMLTLEPDDIDHYLETPEASPSAGPAQ